MLFIIIIRNIFFISFVISTTNVSLTLFYCLKLRDYTFSLLYILLSLSYSFLGPTDAFFYGLKFWEEIFSLFHIFGRLSSLFIPSIRRRKDDQISNLNHVPNLSTVYKVLSRASTEINIIWELLINVRNASTAAAAAVEREKPQSMQSVETSSSSFGSYRSCFLAPSSDLGL